MNSKPKFATCLVFTLVIFLIACGNVKISDINRDPGRYANKEVSIAGEVIGSWGALGQGAFEVDDGTGRIWVLSESFGVPSKGARVRVTGRVQSGISLGGRSFGTILRQTKRRQGD